MRWCWEGEVLGGGGLSERKGGPESCRVAGGVIWADHPAAVPASWPTLSMYICLDKTLLCMTVERDGRIYVEVRHSGK